MSYNIVHLTNPETSNYSYLGSTVSIFEYKYPLAASVIVSTSHRTPIERNQKFIIQPTLSASSYYYLLLLYHFLIPSP